MRLTTSQMFDRPTSMMATLTQQADKLQVQIATGKRIDTPSDDATAWQRLDTLKRADAGDAAYGANIKLAQGLLAQSDSALENAGTQLQRAQELSVQAANGTLSAENRTAIRAELDVIIDDLVSLANTRDVRGQPVFGGAGSEAPYVKNSDGSVSYVASGEASAVPIDERNTVATSVSGDRAFGEMFAVLAAICDAVAGGEPPSGEALDGLQAATEQVSAARASVGARGIRLDFELQRFTDVGLDREEERTSLESTDVTAAITELQKTLTILQATQASFTKLSGLSLFDYLR
jgi:flagellar hook-associated protein 3 FlgL